MKMMDDNLIPYIIDYQRSGLTAIIAENTNIKHAADYTPVQNTNELLGYKKVTNMDKSHGVTSISCMAITKLIRRQSTSTRWNAERETDCFCDTK